METFIYFVLVPFFLFWVAHLLVSGIRKIFEKPPISKEIKIPDGMRVDSEIHKEGGKYKGVLKITYIKTIKIINKPHPIEASTEEELNKKYQEIINKYIIQ